jgi:hypothetical protein
VKKSAVILSFLILSTLFARAGEALPPGMENVPAIVADVNGKQITRNDLLREMVASAGNDAVDRLVRRILIEQAAKAAGMAEKVTPEVIEQQYAVDRRDLMAQLIRTMWDKDKEFPIADILRARFRMSIDEYKNLIIRQRLLTKYTVVRDLQPTENQLVQYFNAHLDDFQPPSVYHASHILFSWFDPRDFHRGLRFRSSAYQKAEYEQQRLRNIRLKRDDNISFDLSNEEHEKLKEFLKSKGMTCNCPICSGRGVREELDPLIGKARKQAETVLKDLRAGTIGWDQAVRQYSQDPQDRSSIDPQTKRRVPSERELAKMAPGDVGKFTKAGPLEPDFYEAAKNMKPGEIGGPVQTIYGFHLIKMIEVQNPAPVTFEQVRDKVERAYVDNEIMQRSDAWMRELLENATLQSEPVLLWPPQAGRKSPAGEDPDPVVGSVNGTPIKRSDIWRELFRSESDDALDRLIHFQIVMTMLKTMGIDRLEWESADPKTRSPGAPRAKPVTVGVDRIDLELNDDRLRKEKEAPDMSFSDYIYRHYGQTVDEYRQKIEAGLILRDSIRSKVKIDDKTLVTEWALAKDDYIEPVWYELSQILIVPTGGMDRADKTAMLSAVTIADQVRKNYIADPKPETWKKLVQDWSMDSPGNKLRDGNIGACYPDVRHPDIPETPMLYREVKRQRLEKGQVSAPIKSFKGYHIVRVDAVHASMVPDFSQVRARVERDYLQERAKMYTDVWVRSLSSGAKIERYLNAAGPADLGPRTNVPLQLPKD